MSWQLGAFTVLLLGLAGGFAWYERTRPNARVVALVATLAAFAALGRIAFAAIPNVKPTTDIVLIAGYALGGAPGFVIGAIAGLTSNFFFGQGPWTVWQMAGWGLTGLIGAGLATATRRRIGRWQMAAVCAVAGFGFTAFQDLGDWFSYSDHTAAQLGIYVGKGVGFDAVHAAGCLVFALAFGPALNRSISRFAMRTTVTWRTATPLLVLALALAVPSSGREVARAAAGPAAYLLSAQNSDGGFGGAPGQPSSQLFSGWAALGLAAVGYNAREVRRGARSLTDYLSGGVASATDAGSLERTILAVAAAGMSPSSFGGRNLVAALERDIRADGSVLGQTNLTSFGVLALRAAGVSPAPRTLSWLARQQDRDGGFNFATGAVVSDVDDTASALEALSVGHAGAASRAVAFIERHQNADGGFPLTPGAASNAQSTAWAVQGLVAAGVSGGPVNRAIAYLDSLLAPDGHVRYSRSIDQTPVWVTAESVMALARKPLPLAPVARGAAGPVAGAHPPRMHPIPVHRLRSNGPRRRPGGARHGGKRPSSPKLAERLASASTLHLSMRLASDAGILDALALAPLGIG